MLMRSHEGGPQGLKPVFFSASSGTAEAVPFPSSLLARSAAEEKCIGPFGCAQGRLFVGSRPLRVRLRRLRTISVT